MFFLDGIVYKLIGWAYELLIDIANTSIFTEDVIDFFASKVYSLLGIFMLFKVSFSIMTYIVNPDEFSDKNKGFGKVVSNIVITVALLIATPWIFSQAMDLQRIVLKDNIIGKIFSAQPQTSGTGLPTGAGEQMAYETFTAFYHINQEFDAACSTVYETASFGDKCEELIGNIKGSADYATTLYMAHNFKNASILLDDYSLLNQKSKNSDAYIMEYMPIISTIAGGLVTWILIMFCLDIALRSVKIGFLRMIAPIPIVSRIDPKKGTEVFNKWLKECTSTYLDLFIRLIAINFAIFIISQMGSMGFVDQSTGLPADVNFLVKFVIILGALLFAKQLPKLIESITGIKMSSDFTLNPLKKLSEVPLLGRPLAAAGQLAGHGALIGGRALFGRTLGKAFGGLGNMAKTAWKNKGLDKADRTSMKTAFGIGAKDSWDKSKARMSARWATGLDTAHNNVKGFVGNITGTGKDTKWKSVSLDSNDDYVKGTKAFKALEKEEAKGQKLDREYQEALAKDVGKKKFYSLDKETGQMKPDQNKFLASKFGHRKFNETFELMNRRKDEMYAAEYEKSAKQAALDAAYSATYKNTQDRDAAIAKARKEYTDASKAYGKAQGRYSLAEKQHEISRGMYKDDAFIQDAFEKYQKTKYEAPDNASGNGQSSPNPSGPNSGGPNTTGPNTTGPNTTGPNTTGPNSGGPNTTGPNSGGPNTTGPNSGGSNTTGPNSGGSNTTGPNPEPNSKGTVDNPNMSASDFQDLMNMDSSFGFGYTGPIGGSQPTINVNMSGTIDNPNMSASDFQDLMNMDSSFGFGYTGPIGGSQPTPSAPQGTPITSNPTTSSASPAMQGTSEVHANMDGSSVKIDSGSINDALSSMAAQFNNQMNNTSARDAANVHLNVSDASINSGNISDAVSQKMESAFTNLSQQFDAARNDTSARNAANVHLDTSNINIDTDSIKAAMSQKMEEVASNLNEQFNKAMNNTSARTAAMEYQAPVMNEEAIAKAISKSGIKSSIDNLNSNMENANSKLESVSNAINSQPGAREFAEALDKTNFASNIKEMNKNAKEQSSNNSAVFDKLSANDIKTTTINGVNLSDLEDDRK